MESMVISLLTNEMGIIMAIGVLARQGWIIDLYGRRQRHLAARGNSCAQCMAREKLTPSVAEIERVSVIIKMLALLPMQALFRPKCAEVALRCLRLADLISRQHMC